MLSWRHWGLTPLNFSKQNLKLEFMGSDPLTKFLRWCLADTGLTTGGWPRLSTALGFTKSSTAARPSWQVNSINGTLTLQNHVMEWIFLKRQCALYFSPHSREALPAAWPFFAPKTGVWPQCRQPNVNLRLVARRMISQRRRKIWIPAKNL